MEQVIIIYFFVTVYYYNRFDSSMIGYYSLISQTTMFQSWKYLFPVTNCSIFPNAHSHCISIWPYSNKFCRRPIARRDTHIECCIFFLKCLITTCLHFIYLYFSMRHKKKKKKLYVKDIIEPLEKKKSRARVFQP